MSDAAPDPTNGAPALSRRAKATLIAFALLLAGGLGARLAFGGGAVDDDDDAPIAPTAQLAKGPDGRPALKLVQGQAEALDLQTAQAEPAQLPDTRTLHGVALDPLPFLDLEARRRSAQTALQATEAADRAAQAELARVTTLHGADRGASDKALQEATRAAAEAHAARVAAEGEAHRAQAAWAETGLDATTGLADFSRILVRLDLPSGAPAPSPMPKQLMGTVPGLGAVPLRILGLAPGGSPLTGGLALLALAPGRGLRPGLPVDADLKGPAARRVVVPEAAVVWSGGQAEVFIQVGDGLFEPREVTVAATGGGRTALAAGLSGGETVVRQGALGLQGEYARLAEGQAIGAGGV